MRSNDPMENLLRKLRHPAPAAQRERTLQNIFRAMDEVQEPVPAVRRVRIGRMTVPPSATRLALAAAVILIVLGGISFWPAGSKSGSPWWLGSRAAWGRELLDSLEKIDAVIYRQRVGHVSDFGLPEMSRSWERRYNAKDRYRRDRYDDGVNITNTQWVFPEGNDLRMVEVSYDYQCYFERKNEVYGFVGDFTERMRSYVRLLDKADRILNTEMFDGRECVGFEIHTARYGNNPQGPFDRIWFDIQTRLPARIERHRPDSGFDAYLDFSLGATETMIIIHDQFEYLAKVPTDLFVPVVPPGYVKAHPDEVRTARDKQVKGEMVFAQVPQSLKERILAALTAVSAGAYTEGSARICFTKNAWRRDHPSGGKSRYTVWYTLRGALPDGPFELIDGLGVEETLVDYSQKTCRITAHMGQRPPRHPMTRILFLAGLIDRADRFYESATMDGVKCFGFDVSAKKYGDNPDGAFHRVWFDAATNLPVRMETHWPNDDGAGASTTVQEQFDWNPEWPEGFFLPQVPPEFTVKAKE